MTEVILLGYIVAIIMIGIQSLAFEIGQRYLGVWVEYTWMAQLSATYFPFLAALTLGFIASSTEEVAFRLFAINLGKKFLRNTIAAVVVASLIWGFAHSNYLVFPMWFRGLEVTCLGLFLGYIYLRFGLICVFVAHYLFDVFWGTSAHLLGTSTPSQFYSALIVLLLPALFGIIAYIKNKREDESPLRWLLNKHQLFNLEVLKNYLRTQPAPSGESLQQFKQEIAGHGWDMVVVEKAVDEIYPHSSGQNSGNP